MARLISLWTICCLLLACGNFERSNPFDPTVEGNITDLNTLLVGTWSRADIEKNQVYTFKKDGVKNYYNCHTGERLFKCNVFCMFFRIYLTTFQLPSTI